MILDIKLKSNTFIVTIHKKFFENEILKSFEKGNKLTEGLLSYLGVFVNSEKEFGFGGCLKKFHTDEQEDGYFYYEFPFPKQSVNFLDFQKIEVMSVNGDERLEMRRFMLTVHVCGYYVAESMYFEEKNVLQTKMMWEDQKITFNLHDNHSGAGYSIAGKLYQNFNRKYKSLDEERRKMLETYVHEEMKRCCFYFSGQELTYEQIHIQDNSRINCR